MDDTIARFTTPESCEQFALNVEAHSPGRAREARIRAVELRTAAHAANARKTYDDVKGHFSVRGSGVVGEFEEAGYASACFVNCGTRRCRILFDPGGGGWLSFQDEVALADKGCENVAMTLVAFPFAEAVKAIELWVSGASLEDLQRQWPLVRPSLAGAYAFLDYFEDGAHREPDEQHWRNGATVSRRWVQLLRTGATQTDIDEVTTRLNAPEPHARLGWSQLRAQFLHWAQARGFRV